MSDTADRLIERLLVVRCQGGDEGAFAELIERYDRRLRYYVRTLLGPPFEVDDVLQEVWLDVFRSIGKLKDAGALAAWLYRIARDRALRRRRGGRWMECAPLPEDLADGAEGEDRLELDDAAEVRTAMEALGREHREVLALRYLEELCYEEIAGVVGCPVGKVRSRLFHAKRALRRAVEEMRDDERTRPRQGVVESGCVGPIGGS